MFQSFIVGEVEHLFEEVDPEDGLHRPVGTAVVHAVHGSKALLVNQGERLVSENLGPTSLQALSLLRRHQELGLPEALLRVSYSEHPHLPRPGAAPTTFYYIIPTLPQAGEGFLRTNQCCYGLAKEGARHHGYTGARGYHPLLAVAAGTGDVLMARLREGRAHTARGAAHFLRETVGRVRYSGARGQLHGAGRQRLLYPRRGRRLPPDGCPLLHRHPPARPPCGISSRRYPKMPGTPIPYWMDGAADVAETTYTPFQAEADAAPVRLIVRRVKPTPGSQLALFARYSYHAFITDRDGETLELDADHRRHAEIENAIRDLKYGVGLNHLPSGRFAANGAWLAVQVMAHNLARWTARIGLGERTVITKTLRRRVFALVGRITRSARRLTLHLSRRWPWEDQFSRALARLRAIPLPA